MTITPVGRPIPSVWVEDELFPRIIKLARTLKRHSRYLHLEVVDPRYVMVGDWFRMPEGENVVVLEVMRLGVYKVKRAVGSRKSVEVPAGAEAMIIGTGVVPPGMTLIIPAASA